MPKPDDVVWSALDAKTSGEVSQAELGAQSLALILSSFFKELCKQGLVRDEAIILTAKYFDFILTQSKGNSNAGN